MNFKKVLLYFTVGLLISNVSMAGDFAKHPHLRRAHGAIENALKALAEANNGKQEFGGHREKAEELLKQADQEVDAAADYANQHPDGKK